MFGFSSANSLNVGAQSTDEETKSDTSKPETFDRDVQRRNLCQVATECVVPACLFFSTMADTMATPCSYRLLFIVQRSGLDSENCPEMNNM
jgi:hypothetical protein